MSLITLVGLGVVGKAILNAHVSAGLEVRVVELDKMALERLNEEYDSSSDFNVAIESDAAPHDEVFAARVRPAQFTKWNGRPILIESIAERLDLKQAFFAECENWMSPEAVLASNTSTLPIESVGALMKDPSRLIGMHFFMPVEKRSGVEVIASRSTDRRVVEDTCNHAIRLGKQPFCVGDRPGFVVNRMLSPYINEAISLLCRGADAAQIEDAARLFGMPISPLELVDVIGTRTAFDGGRVYWQAYPDRMNPSPLLPALVKRGRFGCSVQRGFYDYSDGQRSEHLAQETLGLVDRYRRNESSWTVRDIEQRLAATMWIESQCVLRDGVVDSPHIIDQAMRGGLGFGTATEEGEAPRSFLHAQASRQPDWITQVISRDESMALPEWLAQDIVSDQSVSG